MIQTLIKEQLINAVEELYPELINIALNSVNLLSHPEEESFGDFSSPLAMALAKKLGQAPLAIAQAIAEKIEKGEWIESVTAVSPGFINVRLKPSFLWQEVERALAEGDGYGRSADTGKTILFEYGDPNTHKNPHIGHLFSYIYGESSSRILRFTGNSVVPLSYQGDIGLHVAKCMWGYYKNADPDIAAADLSVQINYLQECYQLGAQAYEDSPETKQEIDQLNRRIYSGEDPQLTADWQKTRDWSVAYYELFEKRLGINYARHYFESELLNDAVMIVKRNTPKIFQEDEGAHIFKGDEYGLHTRVFLNRFGNPTYEAKDLALAELKNHEYSHDLSIITTASEQSPYWQVVKKALTLLDPPTGEKTHHIGFGMINLTSGKMSSRTGNIVTAIGLVELVKDQIIQYIQANRDYPESEIEQIGEMVAQGAIKYSFLKSAATKNISFDLESSISFEGNSGPYLQYAYARCQSVLKKATSEPGTVGEYQANDDELAVLRWLYRFPEVVKEAADQYSPHVLCGYLFELAQRYSYFYNQHQILTDDPASTAFRLMVTRSVAQVLKNGLYLLGIEVADRI